MDLNVVRHADHAGCDLGRETDRVFLVRVFHDTPQIDIAVSHALPEMAIPGSPDLLVSICGPGAKLASAARSIIMPSSYRPSDVGFWH